MKNYIDIMEKVLEAYTVEQIRNYTGTVEENMISEHGFPRLCANIGILVSNGRKTELKEDFIHMMNLCCEQIPFARAKNGGTVGNDFSVKEIVFCLLEAEKSGLFSKELTDKWRNDLSKINPYDTYTRIAPIPAEPVNNWAAFGAASEQLRKYAGIGDESAFIENQVKSQLFSFDENGMYRDPHEPMVYDAVTRLQLATLLYFGYNGKFKDKLEEHFIKSADITLEMQSVTGEIPYGGRSNQFLHNEAFYAALCEFYAGFFKKRGDYEKAGLFKYAAQKAVDYLVPWLQRENVTHIKNNYPADSGYGCEGYAYFDKYMITTGSWLYLAYAMCDDKINAVEPPKKYRNFVSETSEHFHKVLLRYGDYYAEYDTNADYHYDATGLGRIHKKGIPSVLCLTSPITAHSNYKLDIENSTDFSICAGIKTENGFEYAHDGKTKYTLTSKGVTEHCSYAVFECTREDGSSYTETLTLSDEGAKLTVKGKGKLAITFPAFLYDGKTETSVTQTENSLSVTYNGYTCTYITDGKITDRNIIAANRNGHYKLYIAEGEKEITLEIKM